MIVNRNVAAANTIRMGQTPNDVAQLTTKGVKR